MCLAFYKKCFSNFYLEGLLIKFAVRTFPVVNELVLVGNHGIKIWLNLLRLYIYKGFFF